jgi:hypothetical protein
LKSNPWLLELTWWLLTAVIAAIILLPIHLAGISFHFWQYNLFFILISFTFGRFLFFFHLHPLYKSKIFKITMIFLVPVLFFPMVEGLHSFIEFNDREGIQTLLSHLSNRRQNQFRWFIQQEYLILAIAAFVSSFLMIIKMIRALWKQYYRE